MSPFQTKITLNADASKLVGTELTHWHKMGGIVAGELADVLLIG